MMSLSSLRVASSLARSINQSALPSRTFQRTFTNAAASVKTKQPASQPNEEFTHFITDLSLADFEQDELPYDKNDPIFKQIDPTNIHTTERLTSMAEKYKWINWTRFGDHLHRSDVHFFDEEVKIVDDNLDIEADAEALELQAKDEEHNMNMQTHQDKLRHLLPFTCFIDRGQTVRVTTYGKLRTSWVMLLAGDKCGTATYGFGKGELMIDAIREAKKDMIHNLTFLPLVESRTILYETVGKFGVCKVAMRPLPRGTGMVAGIIPRMVFEAFGIEDINAKVIGRALPKHQLLACWQALTQQRGLRELSIARGSRSHKMFERGTQKPRTPPRAVLAERSQEIGRKLKEATELMVRMSPESMLQDIELEEKYARELDAQVEGNSEPIDITDPNSPYDADDLADHNEVDQAEGDEDGWGARAIPPNYVPVLPPRVPRIPTAYPVGSRGPSKK